MWDFLKNNKGSMASTFALALMGTVISVGAAVDINCMQNKRIKYQGYADAAVLAAAASGESDLAKLKSIVTASVSKNNSTNSPITTDIKILEDGTYHVDVSSNYDMILMGIIGNKQSTISVNSESPARGGGRMLNLALVLDVTGSMYGSKLKALKKATKDLTDDLNAKSEGNAMISIVPFATHVKLPTSMAGQSWINVQSGGTWDGCVGSRQSPWHKRSEYQNNKIQGFTIAGDCHSALIPLTNDYSKIKTAVNSLTADKQTYIPSGLIWGWRALTPGAPLTEANTPDYASRENALVLMTDGDNSVSYGDSGSNGYQGVYHSGTDKNAADNLTAELCASIKSDGITIYTVAFEVFDTKTISMLQNCASSADMFYDAQNAAALKTAFKDIGGLLGKGSIRLSK